jgi:ProP effector
MVDEVLAALRTLTEQFPHCFAWHAHRPLKIGIHKDLEARGIDARVARLGLHRYCRHIAYQHALVEGAIRIDLDGQSAGIVTHQEAAYAAKNYEAILRRAVRKRQAQHEQVVRERKAANAQQEPTVISPAAATPPVASSRASFADLRAAARQRRERGSAPRR